MTDYTFQQLESIWSQAAAGTQYASSAWSSLMASIAMAESSGNSNALNPNDNGGLQSSYGLWQISTGTHAAPNPNWANPTVNAQLAIQKLQSQGLSAWGTYTSGAYQQFLPRGTTLPPGAASGRTGGVAGAGAPGAGGAGGTAGATTTGISGNPLTWLEAPIAGFGWAGSWITGGQVGPVATEAQGLGGIIKALAGITTTFSKLSQLWLTLMSPAFWLRVGAFFVGLGSLFWGLHFLKESL